MNFVGEAMIRQVTSRNASANETLLEEMFRARKRLFKDRLNWDVTVDARGREMDEYDRLDPLYVIAVDDDGHHQGSCRLLPTTGETMLRDHFTRLFDGVVIESPLIWECTRFCVDSEAGTTLTPHGVQKHTTELFCGMVETGIEAGIQQVVGVFDRRMIRIYSRSGWSPEVVGQSGEGRDAIFLGIWDVDEPSVASIREAGGLVGPVLEKKMPRAQRSGAA